MFGLNDKLIGNYSKRDLKELKAISLTLPISPKALNNFAHIKDNTTIILNQNNKDIIDEVTYYQNVTTVIERLKELNKNYTIRIKVTNRELFRKSNIIKTLPKNITLTIDNDEYLYNLDEYKVEEKKLLSMVSKIKNANLSPLETYLAVYDVVKKYKPYKESDSDPNESRKLKHILDDNNPYIVCAGFSKLLKELLDSVGIPSKYISVMIDTSYEKGMTVEEKVITYAKHARNLIKIDDDKYHIHGYYIADSTWDNNPKYDLFINSILTFDRKKEAKRLEKLDDIDLLMDYHNLMEFQTKIKYFFKKGSSYPGIDNKTEENLRKRTYKDLYLKICDILATLDYDKYMEIYQRYNDLLNVNLAEVTSNSLEVPLANLLIDYAKYIIPLSNNQISLDTIFRAMTVVKKEVDWLNNEEIKIWLTKVIKDNIHKEKTEFPYNYDYHNKEAYVEKRK